jgi:hypothetical protein
MTRRHKTQIIYNEWNIPPQAGQVRRLADGFEFSMRRTGYLIYPFGPRSRKVIRDDQITKITHWPGRHGPGWIIVAFDRDDEIMLLDPVLADVDVSTASFAVTTGYDDGSSARRRGAMVERQRSLGPVSWEHGRLRLDGMTSRNARRWKLAWIAMVVAALTAMILAR